MRRLIFRFLFFPLFLSGSLFCFSAENDSEPNLQLPMQLATVFHDDIDVRDYWISEKLDGIRARWTGSRLLTRNGNVINAPDWFVKDFPSEPLDGELWSGRGQFEFIASVVLTQQPSRDWQKIMFMVFDLPAHTGNFSQRWQQMQQLERQVNNQHLRAIRQFRVDSLAQLLGMLEELTAQGAEGLMLHHRYAIYRDGRSEQLMKLKKYQDAEALVLAYLPGKGKYSGMLGALLVETPDGRQFKIGSGFTDLQRQHPPPIGSIITYKFYGTTAKGLPRFASFLHIRQDPPMTEPEPPECLLQPAECH